MSNLGDRNLYLVAAMLSGKTKISKILGPRMDREVFEMDAEIEKLAGMSIPEIFSKCGEPHFRDLETQVLLAVSDRRNLIVSTGGGVVCRPENIGIMRRTGVTGWIDVDLSVLKERAKKKAEQSDRPLLLKLEKLHAERRPLYEQAADFTVRVHVEVQAEMVAETILRALANVWTGER